VFAQLEHVQTPGQRPVRHVANDEALITAGISQGLARLPYHPNLRTVTPSTGDPIAYL
jgi:hypothetical protein